MNAVSDQLVRPNGKFATKPEFARYGSGTPLSIEAVDDQLRGGLTRGWFRSASNYSIDLGGVALPIVCDNRIFSLTVGAPINRIENRMFQVACLLHHIVGKHLGLSYLTSRVQNLTSPPLDQL